MNWSDQALKYTNSSGGREVRWISVEELMAKAGDALVRGKRGTNDARVLEKLDMHHQNETIPTVNIDNFRKAIKVERNEDWSVLEEHRSLLCGL